jgi:uncharacterized protein YgiM (DUF1202 family)
MALLRLIAAVLLLCAGGSAHAKQQVPFTGEAPYLLPNRIALVVGVENYSGGGAVRLDQLPGAANDARHFAEILRKYGFDATLLVATPPSLWVRRDAILDAISDLAIAARDARTNTGRGAIVVFYFAGHGVQMDSRNFLLASDFRANFVEDVTDRGIELEGQVANKFGAPDVSPELKLVIVDACRTTVPLSLTSTSYTGTTVLRRGIFSPSFNGAGFELGKNHNIFLYAALPGAAAFDGDIGGQFTTNLIAVMKEQWDAAQQDSSGSTISLDDLFQQTKTLMMAASPSPKKQIPQIDETFASVFYPLPTMKDFQVEKGVYQFVDSIPPREFADARNVDDFQACEFTKILSKFSQYSYFSHLIIDRIKNHEQCHDTSVPHIYRGPDGSWHLVPSQEASAPIRKGGLSPKFVLPPTVKVALGFAESDETATVHKLPEMFAQSELPKEPTITSEKEALAPINFGDLRKLLSNFPQDVVPVRLPEDSVPLNRAVVTKMNANIRSAAGTDQNVVSSVAAGEFLEVVGATKNKTWLEVRHPTEGQGYISGDLVEPALVDISKTITFEDPGAFEPTKEMLVNLTGAFGALGGVAIVDGWVTYPKDDAKIGIARAAAVRSFVQSLLSPPDKNRSRVYIKIKEDSKSEVPKGNVVVTLVSLPLNQAVRVTIAQTVGKDTGIKLDLPPSSITDSEPTSDGAPSPPIANICTQPNQCKSVPNVITRSELKDTLGQVMNVQPPSIQPPRGVEGIRNTLKLLRF